ncbi:MAG: hypothetical protein ABH858_02695 [Candidatus Omnitrophota bacterium]
MRCPSKSELTLFYYQDVSQDLYKRIEDHLARCSDCGKQYSDLASFLGKINKEEVKLSSKDIETILYNVKRKIEQPSFLDRAREMVNRLLEQARLGFLARRQFVPVVVILLLVLTVMPFLGRRQDSLDKELAIFEIEMELSVDNLEGSLFDLYEQGAFSGQEAISESKHSRQDVA